MNKINLNILVAMFLGLILAIYSWAMSIEGPASTWTLVILGLLGAMIVWNPNKLPIKTHLIRHYLLWPWLGLNLGGILNYHLAFLRHGHTITIAVFLLSIIVLFVLKLYTLRSK